MSLITRYVLVELIKVFALTWAVCTGLMMLMAVREQFLERGYTLHFIVYLLPYLWPDPVRYSITCASILATCTVFGRMAKSNELLALSAAGVKPLALVLPVILLTVPLGFLCAWLEDLGFTWGHDNRERVTLQSASDIAYDSLRARRSYRNGPFEIVVQRLDGDRMVHPMITVFKDGDEGEIVLVAEEGYLRSAYPDPALRVTVYSGSMSTPQGYTISFNDDWVQDITLPVDRGEAYTLRRVVDQRQKIDGLRNELAQLEAATVEEETDPQQRRKLSRKLLEAEQRLEHFEARLHKKWSTAFCCLFGTMLSIPLSILLRTADLVQSFFICFLPIILFNEPATTCWYELANVGRAPEISIWICDATLALVSACLLWRVQRH